MPLQIIMGDITRQKVDAIVNAANNSLLGGGGVDGAIHRAAGPGLLEECRSLNGCDTGDAKITGGYDLPARHVIHTVGPIWQGGHRGEELLLRSAYRRSLEVAAEHGLDTVAFSLISSGAYRYPKDQALDVAVSEISRFLEHHDLSVYLVIYDRRSFRLSKNMIHGISDFMDERLLAQAQIAEAPHPLEDLHELQTPRNLRAERCQNLSDEASASWQRSMKGSLEDFLNGQEETFSRRLLQLIDEKGKTDVEVYKKANVDRKLFSKIRNNPNYQPGKATVLAFAIALRLSLRETRSLLRTAGYALSPASRSDLIIEYFIRMEDYDIHRINEALFYFNEHLLGA